MSEKIKNENKAKQEFDKESSMLNLMRFRKISSKQKNIR